MKRQAFLRGLKRAGCILHRHGSRHDIYMNLGNGKKAPVPRHKEIKDTLAKLIQRQLGIEASDES